MSNSVSLELIEQELKNKPRHSNFQKNWREWLAGYLMILPNFLGFFIFMLIPILATIFIGFTNWDLINAPRWVGLLNYKILFRDFIFWTSLKKPSFLRLSTFRSRAF